MESENEQEVVLAILRQIGEVRLVNPTTIEGALQKALEARYNVDIVLSHREWGGQGQVLVNGEIILW